jgi:hypothetical protein
MQHSTQNSAEATDYLIDLVRELATVSRSRNLHFVCYLLEMALEELIHVERRAKGR